MKTPRYPFVIMKAQPIFHKTKLKSHPPPPVFEQGIKHFLILPLLKPVRHPGFWSKNLDTFGQKQNLWVKLNYKVFGIALVLKFKYLKN